MGGMIGQTIAIRRPERVLSLASMLSSTGDRRVGTPKLRVWSLMMRRAPQERDAYIRYFTRVFGLIGLPAYLVDEERTRELAAATYDRCHYPAGTARQLGAIMASGSRTAPAAARGAHRRDPRRSRPAGPAARRPGNRPRDPECGAPHGPRNGPRHAEAALADVRGRDGEEHRASGRAPPA